MESRGPPIEPIGPPLLPTSPYNGNARPPTRAEESTPIAARIVRSDRSAGSADCRLLPVDGRSDAVYRRWVGVRRLDVVSNAAACSPSSSRSPHCGRLARAYHCGNQSRVEGGELDQGHFRSARRSRDDGRCGRDRSAGRGHVVAGRR